MAKKILSKLTAFSLIAGAGLISYFINSEDNNGISVDITSHQADLCKSQMHHKSQYLRIKDQPNYIDKEKDLLSVFKYRDDSFSKTISDFNGLVKNWKGFIKIMTIIDEGVVLHISLLCPSTEYAENIIVLRNPATTALIKNGSTVYQKLRRYKEGNLISFSGKFIEGESKNFEEGSFTKSGSMDYPEIYFHFTDLADI